MKKNYHYILFVILLIVCSVFFYVLHYLIFRDLHHIFLYLVGDIAFVFIEVLLVTLIIEWLSYMKHLRDNYPYLFSLAVRINPFDREASAVVKET